MRHLGFADMIWTVIYTDIVINTYSAAERFIGFAGHENAVVETVYGCEDWQLR